MSWNVNPFFSLCKCIFLWEWQHVPSIKVAFSHWWLSRKMQKNNWWKRNDILYGIFCSKDVLYGFASTRKNLSLLHIPLKFLTEFIYQGHWIPQKWCYKRVQERWVVRWRRQNLWLFILVYSALLCGKKYWCRILIFLCIIYLLLILLFGSLTSCLFCHTYCLLLHSEILLCQYLLQPPNPPAAEKDSWQCYVNIECLTFSSL